MYAPQENKKKGLEPGMHKAVCYSVIDTGTKISPYDNKKKHSVCLGWRLLDQFYPDGNYLKTHKTVTFSMNEKSTLRKFINSWFAGQELDLEKFNFNQLLNKGCTLIVSVNSAGNPSIENVMPLATDVTFDDVEIFDLSSYSGGALPATLDEWKVTAIKESDEYKEANATPKVSNEPVIDEDIPF